jgi:ubiquinone/menaquinone biosynthesis C-methylase UbiE
MKRLLDIGCGSGASLQGELELHQSAGTPEAVQMVGVDIDLGALCEAKHRYPQLHFVCARGEQLPFRAASFDAVVSCVAMPYMDIPVTLREVSSLLRPGGALSMKIYPFSYTWAELTWELQSGSLRQKLMNLAYRLYVMANGVALHLGGFNFRCPFARRRCESFQTNTGIRRILSAAGFHNIDTSCWMTGIVRPHAGNCRVVAVRGT